MSDGQFVTLLLAIASSAAGATWALRDKLETVKTDLSNKLSAVEQALAVHVTKTEALAARVVRLEDARRRNGKKT